MKSLSECCNESLHRVNARERVAGKFQEKVTKYLADIKSKKGYGWKNPYNSDLRIEYGSARFQVNKYESPNGEYYCYPTDKMPYPYENILEKPEGDFKKNTKVMLKFAQVIILATNGHTSYEGADLFSTTNQGDSRTSPVIWYSPEKDQLYDANLKKIDKPGNVEEIKKNCGNDFDEFAELFTGFLTAINEKTKYTKEWFSK